VKNKGKRYVQFDCSRFYGKPGAKVRLEVLEAVAETGLAVPLDLSNTVGLDPKIPGLAVPEKSMERMLEFVRKSTDKALVDGRGQRRIPC
jgi:hypothetical protein